eukprot:TRINITY_DN16325_c0_g1_i3.p1 TRINITY_DN16325_c0_g1~~TRINITY_DN16325_c0_g1_i3.p1  ORF type:complete len:138 (-),score=7.82 TRINITY_DN16325_c0_g1_i3:22-396(-)
MRIGLIEMMKFIGLYFPVNKDVFFESCGLADLITSCYGGRNRRFAEAFAKTRKPLEVLEAQLLKGQKAQGVLTALEVARIIEAKKVTDQFPLFHSIYQILYKHADPVIIVKLYEKEKTTAKSAL